MNYVRCKDVEVVGNNLGEGIPGIYLLMGVTYGVQSFCSTMTFILRSR